MGRLRHSEPAIATSVKKNFMLAQPHSIPLRSCLVTFALALACAAPGIVTAADRSSNAEKAEVGSSKLPVSEIILYSSGVGYFQRDGQIEGDATVDLRFKVDDINDLLKSMVVQDLDGGRISTVTYGSRDPLTKTLKSFAIDLTANPPLVNCSTGPGRACGGVPPTRWSGRSLGVDAKSRPWTRRARSRGNI